jgi:hypothetical protein
VTEAEQSRAAPHTLLDNQASDSMFRATFANFEIAMRNKITKWGLFLVGCRIAGGG